MVLKKKLLVLACLTGLVAIGCNNAAQKQSTKNDLPGVTLAVPDAQALFQVNCASCHNPDRDAAGPMIKGALARWSGDQNRLKAFILNSSKVIANGDPYAVALYNKWNKAGMYSFPNLTEAELDALLTLMK